MYQFSGGSFSNSVLGVPVYVPIVFKRPMTYSTLPDEIKEKIEEHKDEFKSEKDLRNFIRLQMLKS